MPKISICVPAYKNPSGIARLLASVKAQTFSDYEVILTDDTPDDSVREAAMAAGLSNLRYEKNQTRLGATGNWNAAVRLARGEWIKKMCIRDRSFVTAGIFSKTMNPGCPTSAISPRPSI